MNPKKQFAQRIKERFAQKQDELQRIPGVMGDGNGHLYPDGLSNFVYVVFADKSMPVFNTRVAAGLGVKIWVGYAPEEPTLFQVLSLRSETPSGSVEIAQGFAPAKRYEWQAVGGGQDPLHVHLRAFSPLKLGMSATGGMNVDLFRGYVHNGTTWLKIDRQDIDLTSYIPATTGKAAMVLITIDNTGAIVKTDGADVNIEDMDITALPAIPANTVFVCGAVRVYNGQEKVQEGRTASDFVDLRFPGVAAGASGTIDHTALTNLNSTNYYHLTQANHTDLTDGGTTTLHYHSAHPKQYVSASDPTVDEDTSTGYNVNDLWTNTSTDTSFICSDNTNGAAVWTEIGGAGGTGDMVLADIQTVTGAKTFNYGKLILAKSTTGVTTLRAGGAATDTTLNLPVGVSDPDTLVSLTATQTLTNKTITAPTITSANITTTSIKPASDALHSLGEAGTAYTSLYLTSEIDFFAGDVKITRTSNLLTITGGDLTAPNLTATTNITAGTAFLPDANDGAALGTTALQFSDLFLAEGGVINWDNGDATLTQSGNDVTLAGASLTARVKPRTGGTTSSATPTINTDDVDYYELTAQTVDITSFTTNLSGTPTKAQKLWISITGTAARAITWGTSFESSTVTLPTTTVTTNRLDVGFVWNDATSKWRCVAKA
jgi:hypothetical protein